MNEGNAIDRYGEPINTDDLRSALFQHGDAKDTNVYIAAEAIIAIVERLDALNRTLRDLVDSELDRREREDERR
jgi:hypothetical protein